MLGLMAALLRMQACLSGLITPADNNPVVQSSTNARAASSYLFKLSLATAVSSDARVSVDFPPEFSANSLGLSLCSGYTLYKAEKTAVVCSVSGRTVVWTLGSLKAGQLVLGVDGVINPDNPGGSGPFRVRSFSSGFIVDENELFAAVAFATQAASFKSQSLSAEGSLAAGYSPLFRFNLTVSAPLPADTWFRVTAMAGLPSITWYPPMR